MSAFYKATNPYLSYLTYHFHVEQARECGLRIDDFYHNKFFKEHFIFNHIYAQNFHPTTLHERVRDVHFFKKTYTLFKGFSVPDWAQSPDQEGGWSHDNYSRMAWHNAIQDFHSEWTPTPFAGDRLGPNPLQWARFEQYGKGISSKLFFNEVNKPTKYRHGGNLEETQKTLHSFKYADQDFQDILGFDMSTSEGRELFKTELILWKKLAPEVFADVDIDGTWTKRPYLSTEPHFRRMWNHYREFQFQIRVKHLIETGELDQEDLDRAKPFFDSNGLPSANMYYLAQKGKLGDLTNEPSYLSFEMVLAALGLDSSPTSSAEPYEDQFWNRFDNVFELREEQMEQDLPLFVTDPAEQSRIEAIMDGSYIEQPEATRRLA